MVFQEPALFPWLDVRANIEYGLRARGMGRAERRERSAWALDLVHLERFAAHRPHELSGGMRQRVAFLRTLLAGRPVLLLDEPFAALDSLTRATMQEWLAGALDAEPRTVVLVTHDVEEALFLADRVAVLTSRPGRTATLIPVDAERPRPRRETVTAPEFAALKARALEALEC